MRKLVILTLILTFSAFSFAADCAAGEVKGEGDVCTKCTSTTVTGGLANCAACTYSATDKKLTCTACASNFFFSSTAKTACVKCADGCNGGNCADGATAEAATSTDCTSCVDNFLLVDKLCKACVSGCKVCTSDATAVAEIADKACTTCSKGFFHVEAFKSCTGCDATCGACTAAAVCTECKTQGELLNRPVDDGKCVAADKCTGGVGSSSATVKICSKYAAPKPATLNATSFVLNSNHSNSLTLGSLCGPASTEQADKDAEMVGAIVASSVGDAGVTINDIYTVRKAISDKVTADVFGKQTSGATVDNVNWLNIIGTKEGLAALEKFRVPKGNSVLNYICINSLNVPSALQTVKINNNVTLNNAVRFALTFKRALNDTELNNLTCNVANAIFPDNAASQLTVKNSAGKVCTPPAPAKRILQAAAAAAYTDYYFEVPANQNDDTLEAAVKNKLNAVKTAVTGFSTAVGAAVASDPVDVSTPQGVTFGAPVINITILEKNATLVTYSIVSSEAANVWIAVVTAGQAVTEEIVRGNQNNMTQVKDSFALDAKVAQNKTAKNLTASGSYDLYYYAANKYDSSKNTASATVKFPKVSFNTAGSSFSSILAIGSFVLLVLALFI